MDVPWAVATLHHDAIHARPEIERLWRLAFHRKRWIMVANQIGGKSSLLGEVWYAEVKNPTRYSTSLISTPLLSSLLGRNMPK